MEDPPIDSPYGVNSGTRVTFTYRSMFRYSRAASRSYTERSGREGEIYGVEIAAGAGPIAV